MPAQGPFRCFKTSPDIVRLAVMLYVRFPPSLRNVEDLLHERGIEISLETVRFWWNRLSRVSPRERHDNALAKWNHYRSKIYKVEKVGCKARPLRHLLLISLNKMARFSPYPTKNPTNEKRLR